MNTRLEAAHGAQIQGQEVKEQSSIGLGGERDHLSLLLFGSFLKDVLEISGFAAKPGAVVDDLAINLAGCKVDETQRLSSRHAAGAQKPELPHLVSFGLVLLVLYHSRGHHRQVTLVTTGPPGSTTC